MRKNLSMCFSNFISFLFINQILMYKNSQIYLDSLLFSMYIVALMPWGYWIWFNYLTCELITYFFEIFAVAWTYFLVFFRR